MSAATVTATSPTPGTLIDTVYDSPDYRDAFLVDSAHGGRIEDFATGFFLAQPRWLAKVSMNLGDAQSRQAAINAGEYLEGSSVGSWKVYGRTDDEIVFGEHMGFMEYRFSMLQKPDGQVEAATSVKYLKRFGHIYFGVLKPFHIGFIKVALRNASARGAQVHAR